MLKTLTIKFFIYGTILLGLIIGFIIWFDKQNHVKAGEIQVFEGATAKQVTSILEADGNVKNGDVLYYYIKIKDLYYKKVKKIEKGYPVNFKSGTYKIKAGNFESVVKQLNQADGLVHSFKKVTIPEGKTIEEIGEILEKNEYSTKKDFITFTNKPENYLIWKKRYTWLPTINPNRKYLLEGYVQANTYQFPKEADMYQIVDMMLRETDKWYELYVKENTNKKMTFDQAVILASVVERESKFKEDRAKVAQVFFNRLSKGIKLESDITAGYANGVHKVFMYNNDIKTKSPYNTYYVKGLPIGPICSPGKDAFLGTLRPAGIKFKAMYFYARPNGQTFYANTFNEHEKNRLRYEKEWKALEKKNEKK